MSNLTRDISAGLSDAVNAYIRPSESIVVSLPGSIGEALVATDMRVFIARDDSAGSAQGAVVDFFRISDIEKVEIESHATGGVAVVRPKSGSDVKVCFPLFDMDAFKSAADAINDMISAYKGEKSTEGVMKGEIESVCPVCGTDISSGDIFCRACGAKCGIICASCRKANRLDANNCAGCGRKLIEMPSQCNNCGAYTSDYMIFCPDCGSSVQERCGACNSTVMPGWTYCVACGSLLGSAKGAAANVRNEPASAVAAAPAAKNMSQAEIFNENGQELFEKEMLSEAIAEFEKAVALEPDNPTFRCNLAIAYDETGDDERALAEYEKTLELAPDDLTALMSLGYMYNERGDMEKAQEVWRRVVELQPDSPEAAEVRASITGQGNL